MTPPDLDALRGRIDEQRVVEIASRLIAARSDDDVEAGVAEALAAELDRPGIELEVHLVLPRRPNVIARVRGRGDGPALLLNGHTDAYWAPGWDRDPRAPWVADGRLHGGAVSDMLGGVAAMAAALEAAVGADLPGDLVLMAAMHHDTIGLGTKYALAMEDGWPAYGICGEPSALEIHTANGGAIQFEATFDGRTAHHSRAEEGADALAAAVDLACALRTVELTHAPHERLPDLPRTLVGQVDGGWSAANVADRAVVRGDLRIVPGMTPESVRGDLEPLIERARPADVRSRLRFTAVQRPFIGSPRSPLVDALGAAHRAVRGADAAVTSRLPGQAFVTDAADMQAAGIETLVYGPGDWRFVPHESVATADLADAARVYLGTAAELAGDAGTEDEDRRQR